MLWSGLNVLIVRVLNMVVFIPVENLQRVYKLCKGVKTEPGIHLTASTVCFEADWKGGSKKTKFIWKLKVFTVTFVTLISAPLLNESTYY